MKVVICWAAFSGYTTACWRALSQRDEVDLFVVTCMSKGDPAKLSFDHSLMDGINCKILSVEESYDSRVVSPLVENQNPDIVLFGGWQRPSFVSLPFRPTLRNSRFVLAIDNPHTGSWRQRLGRFRHRRLFQRVDRIMVPGERSWQFARLLGFPESKIHRGTYAIDYDQFAHLYNRRLNKHDAWPKSFLYIGRYAKAKALDILVDAYINYRGLVEDAWPLVCCGKGTTGNIFFDVPGIEDRGFVQPDKLPDVLVNSGMIVMPSRVEPWGQVIVESAAAGLPILCSESCGSSVELVRSYYNGITFATDDSQDAARCMCWFHNHYEQLPEMGARSRELAAPYSAQMWAERCVNMFQELMAGS